MTDTNLPQDVADIDLNTCHIGTLRSVAKEAGVNVQRDWKREDIVKAIRASRGEVAEEVYDTIEDPDAINELVFGRANGSNAANDERPKPGFARVLIHKDPTPGHANSAIPVGVNGRMIFVPRGVPVNVQLEYVEVLKNAVQRLVIQKKEPSASAPAGEISEEEVLSYPFQVIAVTPGKAFRSDIDQRAKEARRREEFAKTFNHWPTRGELDEWEKSLIANKVRS